MGAATVPPVGTAHSRPGADCIPAGCNASCTGWWRCRQAVCCPREVQAHTSCTHQIIQLVLEVPHLPAERAAQADDDADSYCAACGEVYGEDWELEDSWICCDSCNRWFHGGCVGMTQVSAAGGQQELCGPEAGGQY